MKRRLIPYVLMLVFCLTLSACGTSDEPSAAEDSSSATEQEEEQEDVLQDVTEADVPSGEEHSSSEAEEVASQDDSEEAAPMDNLFDDNSIYFVVIDGQQFRVGDMASDVVAAGYEMFEPDSTLEAGQFDEAIMAPPGEAGTSFFLCVYNPTDAAIPYSEAVIGGFSIISGGLDVDAEVYGGLRIGSTREEVESAFGVPDRNASGEVSDDKYNFRSSDLEKLYRFVFDENGIVERIRWRNVTYNK